MPAPRLIRASAGPLFLAAIGLVPVAIFLCFIHWQVLIPTNWDWLLDGDLGANILGWNAFRHGPWRWPLGATDLVAWPTGTTVSYTDANALMTLLLKPFSAVLPAHFQFFGPWLLACVLLQFFIAYALLRRASGDRGLRLLGATLITLLPSFLARIPHPNLFAHWTILAALHLFLNVEREGRRDLGWAALLTGSALIHPYLLLMNGAVWGSDVLRRSYAALRRRDLPRLGLLAARVLAIGAAPLLVFWAVNGFGGYALDIEGFGLYSMPLDAPFNPFRVDYSRFVRPAPVANGQLYEGFQYLGAGLLFLMGAAALTLAVSASARGRLKEMGRFLWLVPALLALTALALSDAVQLHGHVVADGKQSWLPPAFTGAFRASGRLFWPCAYALVLGSLELVFALRRRIALALGLTALALQAADLTSFAAIQRLWTARAAEPQRWEKTPSPLWEPLIAKAGVIEFEPPDPHFDETLFYEIGLRATSQNRPVTIMYTSRVRPAQQAIEAASRERFLTGRIDPRRLYVLMDGCAPAGLPAERLRQLDGVLLIPPAGAGLALPVASPPEPFPLGRTVALTPRTPRLRCMLGDDWSVPEPWGVWSEGPAPELILRLGAPPSRDLLLTLGARPYPDAQGVTVIVGGRPVARLNLVGQPADYRLRIPKDALRASLLHILLRVDRPTSPMERGASPDRRRLGIGLGSIRLDETR